MTTPDTQPDPPHSRMTVDDPTLIGVYRETVRPLHQFIARRAGGSRELIEDVLQEVYLRAIEVWHRGHQPDDALPWLKTVAGNLLINYYRRSRPQPVDPALLSELVDAPTPAPGTGTGSESGAASTPRAVALIQWGLAQLPERHAKLIEAFHLDGMTTRQIATARGMTERAVEGRLHRARKALKKQIQPLLQRDGDSS